MHPTPPTPRRLPADFATSAAYPLFAIDPLHDRGWVLHMGADDYRRAGFLDRRALRADMPGWELSRRELLAAVDGAAAGVPVHWLFHIGHCGSTLVSRLLDLLPGVLGLREPLPLLALAHVAGQPAGNAWVGPVRRLLARGFGDTRAVVVKPTSVVTSIAGPLLGAAEGGAAAGMGSRAGTGSDPDLDGNFVRDGAGGRACLLWIDLQSWLATMLRAPELVASALDNAALRSAGIALPAPPADRPAIGLARLWLADQLRWRRLAGDPALAGRMMDLDFADVLGDAAGSLAGLARHYGLPVPADWAERMAGSGLLDRYAKDPREPFDAGRRQRELAAALAAHGPAIAEAIAWADAALPAADRDHLHPRLHPL